MLKPLLKMTTIISIIKLASYKTKIMKKISIVAVILFFTITSIQAQKTITYASKDGVTITADLYEKKGTTNFILLFHQAGWSRGEYLEIAPKLNAMGYSCLAVDLRSGKGVNNITNQTNKAAKSKGKATEFTDAFQDIEASVAYVKKSFNPNKLIVWGSSYSSALALKFAGDHPNKADAVLSFAPGEYFGSDNFIKKSAKNIKIPVFITSSKNEYSNWKSIFETIPTKSKQYYLPKTTGSHGSRALWEKFADNNGYWDAVKGFLKTI